MICPSCSRNHKYRDGMTCACGYHFVFNPKIDGLTDGKFQTVIKQASKNDTYFFTKNQLYTAFCRKSPKPVSVPVLIGIFIVSVFVIIIGLMTGSWQDSWKNPSWDTPQPNNGRSRIFSITGWNAPW